MFATEQTGANSPNLASPILPTTHCQNRHTPQRQSDRQPQFRADDDKLDRPLSRRGEQLHERYVDSDGFALRWRDALDVFDNYCRDAIGGGTVLRDRNSGDRLVCPNRNRFSHDYWRRTKAKILDGEEQLIENYSDPHTALLTLTGGTRNDVGGLRCPIDLLNDLLESRESVKKALARALSEHDYEYVFVLAPTEGGYCHAHVAVYVDGAVSRENFESVIDSHVRNSSVASEDAHSYEKAIRVDRAIHRKRACHQDLDGAVTGLGRYIADQLPAADGDVHHADLNERLFGVVLHATGKRHYCPSTGFTAASKEMFEREYNDDDETEVERDWELIGFEDSNGEFHEATGDDGGGGGGPRYVASRPLPPSVDPVGTADMEVSE